MIYMSESVLRNRAKNFALHVIGICDSVDSRKGRAVILNQIVRSATSIGANVHEANYAASRADFINKLQIALKECYETEYWIDILQSCGAIPEQVGDDLFKECGSIRRILIKSINTAKGT